jgi:hypothetical protein
LFLALFNDTVTSDETASVVRVSGYRSRDTGFDSRRFQIFSEKQRVWNGVHSLVRTTEELLEGKVAAQV